MTTIPSRSELDTICQLSRVTPQPCPLLLLIVEPSLFEKIFSFLDHESISALELSCTVLRDIVVQTRIYKRNILLH